MTRSEKLLVAGLVAGASLATTAVFVAGVAAILKQVITAEQAHLFDMENQEGRDDEINDLLPHPEESCSCDSETKECVGTTCGHCSCPKNHNQSEECI